MMKSNVLRSWVTLIVAMLVLTLGQITASHAEDGPDKSKAQNIVVHLGQATNDLHSAHMALRIGTNLLQHRAKVTLFLDREGVRLADSRIPWENLTWAGNNIADEFDEFVNTGGKVLVCPGCAADAGITASDLRPGATMGNHDSVAKTLLRTDKIIDY